MKISKSLTTKYIFHEEFHGYSILKNDFPKQYEELFTLLSDFRISKAEILAPGGRKTRIAKKFDNALYQNPWREKQFQVEIGIDGNMQKCPTHNIDYFKNRIGIELEWNNKDSFYEPPRHTEENFYPKSLAAELELAHYCLLESEKFA